MDVPKEAFHKVIAIRTIEEIAIAVSAVIEGLGH
jgi:hypothetical protein